MEDVKLLLRVSVMLLPLPIFWALYDQQVAANLVYIKLTFIPPATHTLTGLKVDSSSHSDERKTGKLHFSTRPDASY